MTADVRVATFYELTGILWTAQYYVAGPPVLYAYQAVADPNNNHALDYLWDSSSLNSSMPGAVKFAMPTIADGRIFIAGGVPGYFGIPSPAQCPSGTTLTCGGQLTILY
jgi:hypothetical protein